MDENQTIRQQFAKDFAFLESTVEYAAWLQLHGSYSQRNPHLGPMRTCPLCRKRFRAALGCTCSSHYATTQRAWSPTHDKREKAPKSGPGYGPTPRHEKGFYQHELEKPREGELFSKRSQRELIRRLRQRPTNMGFRHGKVIHDLVLVLQAGIRQVGEDDKQPIRYYSPNAMVIRLAREMHVAVPDERNIPSFAQKYIEWGLKQDKRARRKARRTRQGA